MFESSGCNLNKTLESLAEAFSGSLTWEWDNRFGGVLAAFAANDADRVLSIVNSLLTHVWDGASIGDAPMRVGDAAQTFGRLTPGQLLFTSDVTQDVILLGLWWPWGNGTTISIRFLPDVLDSSGVKKEDLHSVLKGAFGL